METKKYSKSEVGDAKNLENFQDYITYCMSLEPKYNPANDAVLTSEMDAHRVYAWEVFEDLRTRRMDFILVTNRRQDGFGGISKLATRLNGAVSGGGYDKKTVDDFKTISKKIQGRLSKPKTKESEPNQELERAVSNSQQSYDQLLDNFADAIRYLERIKKYEPNEVDLQIGSLQVVLDELRALNKEYFDVFLPFAMALDLRDEVFYDAEKGFIKRIKTSKQYLKSVYGYSSPEYKSGSAIRFVTMRRRVRKKK